LPRHFLIHTSLPLPQNHGKPNPGRALWRYCCDFWVNRSPGVGRTSGSVFALIADELRARGVMPHICQGMEFVDPGQDFLALAGNVSELVHESCEGQTDAITATFRCPILALCGALQSEQALIEAAVAETKLTHFSPLATWTSAAVVLLCRKLLTAPRGKEALKEAVQSTFGSVTACMPVASAMWQGLFCTRQELTDTTLAPCVLQVGGAGVRQGFESKL
jgi:hypothetical protein